MLSNSREHYRPNILLRNPHLNTIYANIFRQVPGVQYTRERIDTPDGDFIDIDLQLGGSDTMLVVAHGLEGDSGRGYVKGIIRAAQQFGWDAAAVNARGCSGEPNRLYSSYHSGKSDDLHTACQYLETRYKPKNMLLAGFSLGGNVVLKYLGEQGNNLPKSIKAAAALSVPTDLKASAEFLSDGFNRVYLIRFLRTLKKKITDKVRVFPQSGITEKQIQKVWNFRDFDDLYTAPAHGFRDAEHYWSSCSANAFIPDISVPTLLMNAIDDPFLPDSCYPHDLAEKHAYVTFETPQFGGHVGFAPSLNLNQTFWHETKAVAFLKKCLDESVVS